MHESMWTSCVVLLSVGFSTMFGLADGLEVHLWDFLNVTTFENPTMWEFLKGNEKFAALAMESPE